MRALRRLALCAALAVLAQPAFARCEGYVPQPKPQNVGRDVVGQDLDEIVERGYVTFAAFEDFPPWSWAEGGAVRGVDVEIGRLIAADLGVEPRFRLVAAGEDLEADLRNNVWRGAVIGGRVANVMLHVPYDSAFACRVEQVVFTGQYARERIAIAYRDDLYPEGGPVPAHFRYDSVGVGNDTISDFYLTGLVGPQAAGNIHRFIDVPTAMAALRDGKVMAVMGPRAELEAGIADGLAVHEPPMPGFSRGGWTIGVAVHQAYRALGYAVDDAIRAGLEDGRVQAIFEAYGLNHAMPER